MRRLAISYGDPAGIGPDVVLTAALTRDWPCELVVIGDREALEARAALLHLDLSLNEYAVDTPAVSKPRSISVLHQALRTPVTVGNPDSHNADAILQVLHRATQGCVNREFDAMVTAPISKSIICDGGHAFSGHTEFLAALTGTKKVVMLLVANELRVALATTHLPLSEVPAAITAESLDETLGILDSEMRGKFGLKSPSISVLGLNPHAGEGGHLGVEENSIITPALERAKTAGINVSGPWPADTAFNPKLRDSTDVYLAMYHDQGLPVLKYASFGHAVNVTLGLPIVRTSVDHGTAFDLAGTGNADAGSCIAAIDSALSITLAGAENPR